MEYSAKTAQAFVAVCIRMPCDRPVFAHSTKNRAARRNIRQPARRAEKVCERGSHRKNARSQQRKLYRRDAGELRTRGIDFICRGDDDYPDSFEEVSDIIVPPEVIFLRGARELPGKRALGVVGTRSSTAEGERIAHDFAREFAEYDITTVTGMALGIDSAATQGALDGGGRVVGSTGLRRGRALPG